MKTPLWVIKIRIWYWQKAVNHYDAWRHTNPELGLEQDFLDAQCQAHCMLNVNKEALNNKGVYRDM